MQRIADWMDRFYVDAIVGLAAPYGVGDLIMALFSLVYMYFSLFILHSIPLTLAIVNNTLRDIAIGLIPFFIGDVLDFFHQSNRQNMRLIEGFVNGGECQGCTVGRHDHRTHHYHHADAPHVLPHSPYRMGHLQQHWRCIVSIIFRINENI